jgi:predicted secreted protein
MTAPIPRLRTPSSTPLLLGSDIMNKKTMTFFITVLISTLLLTGAIPAAASAAGSDTSVLFDGRCLGAPAVVDGQSIILPVRTVCEALGYDVAWSDAGGVKTVVISKDGDTVTLDFTNQTITDNGHHYAADVRSGTGLELISNRAYMDSGLFSSIFALNTSYSTENSQVTLLRRLENTVSITTEKITSEIKYLNTTIQYPQLSGLADENVMSGINTLLKNAAQNALREGQKNAGDMAQAIQDGYTGAVGMCETYYDYTVAYNQNGLISIVLTDYQYAGGAHGTTVQSAYTVDLATGKTLQLSDLMNSGSAYIKFIDAAVRKEIDRRIAAGDLSEFDFSPFTDIGSNPEFYLSNDAIVFYFQQYAYFPYAAGIQEFSVKFTDLGSLLNNQFKFLYSAPIQLDSSAVNTLSIGDIGRVVLKGNATTGYAWHYTISDNGIAALTSNDSSSAAQKGIVGAGSTYTWNFKALAAGNASITFKYYRDWEGASSAAPENTIVYQVEVK